MQIIKVTFKELEEGDWFLLKDEDALKIGTYLGQYFTSISSEGLMNGYWTQINTGYNVTLFYQDRSFGVTTYKFQATTRELEEIGVSKLQNKR